MEQENYKADYYDHTRAHVLVCRCVEDARRLASAIDEIVHPQVWTHLVDHRMIVVLSFGMYDFEVNNIIDNVANGTGIEYKTL